MKMGDEALMMVMISVEEDGKRQGQDFRQVGMEKVEKPNGALELDYHYDDGDDDDGDDDDGDGDNADD